MKRVMEWKHTDIADFIEPIELARIDKIRSMILQCMNMNIEIPKEWIEEYNESVED